MSHCPVSTGCRSHADQSILRRKLKGFLPREYLGTLISSIPQGHKGMVVFENLVVIFMASKQR